MTDTIIIARDGFSVAIARQGAELQSIVDPAGKEWMWGGDPAFWGRHAPILFPIVGRAANDAIRVDGKSYPMGQHGFARDALFDLVASGPDSCLLRLNANDATRKIFPFEFTLDVSFRLAKGALHQSVTVTNTGTGPMAASVGFHPAFLWPAAPAPVRNSFIVLFEKAEPAPIRRIANGRVALSVDTPVKDRTLALDDSLFVADAVIFDQLASRSVWFGRPGEPGIGIDFAGLPYLGIWTKPGAGFLCIEPWQGHHAPEGFDGDFFDMPGVMRIEAGRSETREMVMRCGAPAP
ncbi:aldose 1-epimerase family protein [Kaistia dalseonensis]|uniref:Galactose mutarotase-like enzyme n=1 Tax=Kaistia dalseonensis TaxID=410840 RepID=A0ABU0H9L6_9HYPH|nr:aldose 1-epimerase family protein [Kaistia dalseonensis]MCX5496392.1 aldose 1-epimerase family protein [Kaistia dalseonensis]MDQ0439013.1 galactose mutarotase-like enzyme [Kaistia dalseonensis]